MADNFFRVQRGLSLTPQATPPASPVNGDMYYDTTIGSFVMYNNGFWINLSSQTDVASALSLNSVQFTTSVVQNSLVRITGSLASNLYGLTASAPSKQIILYNESSSDAQVYNQSASEPTAANRISTPGGSTVTFPSGSAMVFAYDAVQQSWIIASGSGGGGARAGFAQQVSLSMGATFVNVLFPSALPNTSYIVNAMLVNLSDSSPQFQVVDITSQSTTGFTASWNFPLDTSNYALGYIVPQVLSQIAQVPISNGATSVTVVLPIPMASTAYVVTANMLNQTDADPQFQNILVTNKTTTGFTANWSTSLDTANYNLAYNVAGYQ